MFFYSDLKTFKYHFVKTFQLKFSKLEIRIKKYHDLYIE